MGIRSPQWIAASPCFHGVIHYLRNKKGCLWRIQAWQGNYVEDGGFYTVRADAYWPNDFGLYNMAGNVSEWTSSLFYESAYNLVQ